MLSLLRAQLRAAAATLSLVVVLIGLLPLVFHQAPGLADQTLLGMPLPWVLLAFGIYPVASRSGAGTSGAPNASRRRSPMSSRAPR